MRQKGREMRCNRVSGHLSGCEQQAMPAVCEGSVFVSSRLCAMMPHSPLPTPHPPSSLSMCHFVNVGSALTLLLIHHDSLSPLCFPSATGLFCNTPNNYTYIPVASWLSSGHLQSVAMAHEGARSSKITYLGTKEKLVSVGFTKQSQRQFKVWDPRNLSTEIKKMDIDQAAGAFVCVVVVIWVWLLMAAGVWRRGGCVWLDCIYFTHLHALCSFVFLHPYSACGRSSGR